MLRHFFKSLEPLTNKLTRTISGVGSSGNGAGAAVSPFERNCETKEQQLSAALKKTLPGITYISVEDISGGCGAMFETACPLGHSATTLPALMLMGRYTYFTL
ncbi:uncharacterized protein LOC113509213 isoform X2 [Galleria mellonella]|uniref:Uncharacterized protein LOC113509213 isoform X2 n=1 Tax=Galleria mellonella TaxID=7137 RepID=A0ABM3MGX8_GALME|nr:uncharacterized protein LOC113509213 isoform X2 [Galleria mellonella]